MIFKTIKNKIRALIVSFLYGLKNTESEMFNQKTSGSESNSIEQKLKQNDLADALLKGEVTEEVEMLRDRTYLVSDESKKYNVIIDTVGTTKAIKKMTKKLPPKCFNEDDYEIYIVMDNRAVPSSVLQGLESVGGYGIKNNYPLKFEYEYSPKFKLDEYVKRIVIRKNNETENLRIDLYVPKFTNSFERLEKIFDNELNKIKSKKIKPLNINFKSVSFISDKAYGCEDLMLFTFKNIKFIDINEFDGRHILIYEAEQSGEEKKITDKYKNKKLRDNYDNKKSRNTKLNLGNTTQDKHKCENCGKEVESNYDFRITKQTIGSGLCNECLSLCENKN